MEHYMIRSGALHPCDKNKLRLQYSLFICALHILCTLFLGNVIFFTSVCLNLKICLIIKRDGILNSNHPIIVQYAYHT